MLTYAQKRALELFLSDYDSGMTFKQICIEVESEDSDSVVIWEGMSCMRGYDISTLIYETADAIQDTIQSLVNDTLSLVRD